MSRARHVVSRSHPLDAVLNALRRHRCTSTHIQPGHTMEGDFGLVSDRHESNGRLRGLAVSIRRVADTPSSSFSAPDQREQGNPGPGLGARLGVHTCRCLRDTADGTTEGHDRRRRDGEGSGLSRP